MNEIEIKLVQLDDVELLKQVARTAFAQTFTNHNQPENVEKYLDESFTIEKLTEELNNENSQFFFAFTLRSIRSNPLQILPLFKFLV
jgi:hypothetical protein